LGAALGLGLSAATFLVQQRAVGESDAALRRVLVAGFLGRMGAALVAVVLATSLWEGDPTGLVAGVVYFYVALVIYEAAAFERWSRRRTGA
ncbi:MAG: hypothetical protein HY722_13545, partial [Planctomycetes bacterium]|nr:hypothetical protein [Planctomycetota bacterium]